MEKTELKKRENLITNTSQVIILAAGVGSRLRPLTLAKPKPLLTVGKQAIIDRQILSFAHNEIRRICVVVGYKASMMMKHLSRNFFYPRYEISYIYNPIYYKTNTVFSLWLASSLLSQGTTFIVNGDLVLDPESIFMLKKCLNPCLGFYRHECGSEEVKLQLKNDQVTDIGKGLDPKQVDGEYVGIAKFDEVSGQVFRYALDRAIQKGLYHIYYDDVIQEILTEFRIRAVDLTKSRIMEIDTLQELEEAIKVFEGCEVDV